MLLKSSLTVCRSISRAWPSKWAAKAAATRSVIAGSLTVSGKLPTVSKSGSWGEPEALAGSIKREWSDSRLARDDTGQVDQSGCVAAC
jgi:hypothetical protein